MADTDVERATPELKKEVAQSSHSTRSGNGDNAFTVDPENKPLRTLTLLETLAAGWNICNSWAGIAATLALGIAQGGNVEVLYGIIIMLFLMGATTLSLAELAARYPTAGGQYHWTTLLAPKSINKGISYVCGCINIFGWIAITAGVCVIPPQLITGLAIYFHPTYVFKRWHIWFQYQAVNIIFTLYNMFLLEKHQWIHTVGLVVSLVSFITIFITCLAISSPKQSTDYVWTYFLNFETGWPDGVVFLTGLVNPNYMFAGIDGAIHLAEDCINASTAVPRALLGTLSIGFVTSFIFAIAMLYSLSDFDAVIGTVTGVPVFEVWRQATRSSGAACFFIILLITIALFALNGCMESASRLTWSFARDDALVLSKYIGKIHPTQKVPVWALFFNSFVVFIIGCVYLGSTTAFNALIGVGLVLQQLCFAIPIALLMFRGRSKEHRLSSNQGKTGYFATYDLGMFGWVCNGITVVWSILCLVIYDLPLTKNPTGLSMNYTCAVLAGMAIFAAANWFGYARRYYKGPAIDVAHFVDVGK